jgi:hypothetical protein
MAVHKSLAAAFLVLAIGGCANLTADRPLFSVADQGPPPLTEGIWIALGEECAEHNVRRRRFPKECIPLEFRREADGAWRIAFRIDLVSNFNSRERAEAELDAANGPYRLILAPAVERETGEGFAPLYVGELDQLRNEDDSVTYAVVAAIGAMPATEMRLLGMIGCDDILRDGPIEGITPDYQTRIDEDGVSHQDLRGCTATSQAAVREAVRRALIENLDEIAKSRFVFVRAN